MPERRPNNPSGSRSNSVDIWSLRNLRSVELHRGNDVTLDYPRHWHDRFYLGAVIKGASRLDCHGASSTTPRGTLVAIAPGEVHANQKTGCGFRCLFIELDTFWRAVEQFVEQSIPRLDLRSGLIRDSQIAAGFLRLHRSLENPSSALEQNQSLSRFLHQLVGHHGHARIRLPRESNEHAAVRQTKRFLSEHCADPISLGDLALLTGLSPYHLNRCFCKEIGMPPHAYQLQVRIAHAKAFLLQGRSLAETAALAGFFDQSHFTNCFKRSERITPNQYLRNRKNLQDNHKHIEYFEPSRK